jgi:SPP1 gp7 family putative phage head morphogenesis protein
VVDSLVRSRALLVANNELIRAHADGQLDALEELGEEEVTAAVEWVTAGDDRVCKLCKPLDGVVLTVAEARGLIPRHVNCRCAWLPAGTRKGQEGKVMRSTLQDVTRAVKRSLRKAPANDGWFEGKAVARKRPKV